MMKRGSITVFLSLILSLMVALICASITSVRVASARTQILNGMDIGLYSLFGQYDRKMLEEYEIFALDGSCGGGTLKLAEVYDNFISYMEPVLVQNGRKLSVKSGGFTGYRLLTDDGGKAFYQQVVNHMQETLGAQGVQLLLENMQDREKMITKAEEEGKKAESGGSLEAYDSALEQAAQNEQEGTALQSESEDTQSQTQSEVPTENPITVIRRIMKMGILELVIPPGKEISSKSAKTQEFVSRRKLQTGLSIPDGLEMDDSYMGKLLFQKYLMKYLGNFSKPSRGGLGYQIEYILGGKGEDMENLKMIAKKLLLIREGVNFACLAADGRARAQAEALALAIASGFMFPPAAPAITAAILFCWSFAESVLDVRELFAGGKVPLVKTWEKWQLSLDNLPRLLDGLDTARKGSDEGLSYEDYLQILLLTQKNDQKLLRAMDMVELSVRTVQGRTNFMMDSCITSMEASVDVDVNRGKVFTVTRQYCYE